MKILWLTWKDRQHPQAGGAEVVNEELAKRLVADGHEVIFLVSGFDQGAAGSIVSGSALRAARPSLTLPSTTDPAAPQHSEAAGTLRSQNVGRRDGAGHRKNHQQGFSRFLRMQRAGGPTGDTHEEDFSRFPRILHPWGFTIIRVGGRFSVYWAAYKYYKAHLADWPDLVIDEMNTIPFFAKFYVKQKNIMLVHQLCREIWFYQMPFPISLIGYLLEPLYLRLLNDREVITVSESSKRDLMRFGFTEDTIHIISEGIDDAPLPELAPKSLDHPLILTLGRVEPMKRTLDILRAFEILKESVPAAKLAIVGYCHGAYGEKLRRLRDASKFKDDIVVTGPVTHDQKVAYLREAAVLAMTSVKEGWGLVVTEAASQGTPSVVYNVDGLRDSVRDGHTGLVTKANTPAALAQSLQEILANQVTYEATRQKAWRWSQEITFDASYRQLNQILSNV